MRAEERVVPPRRAQCNCPSENAFPKPHFGVIIKADVIKFNTDTRAVTAIGHAHLARRDEHGDVQASGDNLVYNLETQKLVTP